MMSNTTNDLPIKSTSELSAEEQLYRDFLSGHSHKLLCTEEQMHQTACLNDGVCFALPEINSTRAQCWCPSDWAGRRCEEAYLDLIGLSNTGSELVTSYMYTVPILLAVCCILLMVIFIVLSLVLKEKPKHNQMETLPHKHHPSIQQNSYSNSEMPTECIVPVPENSVLTTFTNEGQDAMSDYGSNNGEMLTSAHYNNNKETVDLTSKMINSES